MQNNTAAKRYFTFSLGLAALLLGAAACFNWLVNPYLIFNPPIIKGLNEVATENFFKQLWFKPQQLHRIRPRSIIAGTSHAGIAFNPDLLPQPAFNLAVGGSTSYINYRLLQEALEANPDLEQVILEVPLFAFNALDANNRPGNNPEFEKRLSVTAEKRRNFSRLGHTISDYLTSLISWESTRSSLRMINKQDAIQSGKRASFIQYRNGQWAQQQAPNMPTRRYFENSWKKFLHDEWFPAPHYAFALSADGQSTGLDYFQQTLYMLHQHHVHTIIVMAPMHASLLVALQESGLWNTYEQWKRELLRINQQTAQETQQAPFLIVDYSGLNDYNLEKLPEDNQSPQRLQWFYDSAHASANYGDLILHELENNTPRIGTVLTPDTLDEHLAEHRQAVAHYTQEHPRERDTILELIKTSPATH